MSDSPIRWLNCHINETISMRALALAATLYPLLASLPVFLWAGPSRGWMTLGWLWLLSLISAVGVLLVVLREGMVGWEESVERLPTHPGAILDYYRTVYEHPMTEYWVFVVGSRCVRLAWIAGVAIASATVGGPAVEPGIALLLAAVLFLLPFTLAQQILLAALVVTATGTAIGGMPGVAAAAYTTAAAIFAGGFVRMRAGDEVVSPDPEGHSPAEPDRFNGPRFVYFAVPRGLLIDRFHCGGMYFRARDAYHLQSARAMYERDDAAEFIPVNGTLHRGGQLDTAILAARLAATAPAPAPSSEMLGLAERERLEMEGV